MSFPTDQRSHFCFAHSSTHILDMTVQVKSVSSQFLTFFPTLLRTWSNFLRSSISAQQILILVFLSAFLRYLSDSVHRKEEVWNECSLGHCVHFYRNSIPDAASDVNGAVASFYGWTNFQNKSSINENMFNVIIYMLWWVWLWPNHTLRILGLWRSHYYVADSDYTAKPTHKRF